MVLKSKGIRNKNKILKPAGSSKPAEGQKRGRGALLIIISLVSLFVFAFSTYQIVIILRQSSIERAERQELLSTLEFDEESQYYVIPYADLTAKNADFISWIDIPNTSICYPVVYSPVSNDVYIRTSFAKTYAVSGSIFVDFRCRKDFSDRVTIIYGHRMNDNTMFAPLKNYLSQSFYEDHVEIHIYTENGIAIYNVFSSYTADITDSCYTLDFESDSAFAEWARQIKANSAIQCRDSAGAGSRVILLSTCVWNQPEKRNIVVAVYSRTVENPVV